MARGESVAVAEGPPVASPPRARAGIKAGVTAETWPQGGAVPAPGGFFGVSFWQSSISQAREWMRAEAGPGRLLPFVPVAFGIGIALYFTADREPMAAVVVPVAGSLCVAAFLMRRHRWFPAAVMIAAIAAGFATATFKTARIAHGVLARPMNSVLLKGFVETHEERERTDRFVLRVEQMDAPRASQKMERVRLSVRKGTAPPVGSFVELKAKLQPPLSPLRPGSYDFGRDMYFQGIGASGFALGAIKTLEAPRSGGFALAYAKWMQAMRDAIDARIRTVLSADNRAIATALLTGRRDAITTPVNDAMFISGLGHVLSISGYHMAVVAGVVFFAVRALLALSPALTAGFAIKKWSAAAAFIAALFYLLLSGAEVATQRSFFMTAVVLIAIMVDRRAITFRTLAVAAMIVLLLAPEALVHPSFQMSFAATLGLVALVQIGMPKRFVAPDNSAAARAALWGGREIMTLAAASFVAGLATTPYAAFHFHRITPYGVLANLAAMPVVSAVVMPAGLLGIAAIPFGFDSVFWRLMGIGIDWMIAVTQWVAALPGAIGRMAAFGTGPLLMTTSGIVLLGLLRTPLRWSGAGLIALGIVWAVNVRQPDILIAGDGHNVAVRGKDGSLRLMRSSKDAFLLKEWLAADADPRLATDPSLGDGVSCDEAGCVVRSVDGKLIALTLKPDALADDCARASVMVSAVQPPPDCAAMVFDRDALRRQGTLALRVTGHGYAIEAIHPRGVDRPWSPAIADESLESTESAASPNAPRARAPVDVTPLESDVQAED
ncbi:MAG: ComEC family competence protein [Xanthobacteraceae bacterium]|nr:ComEC family competence protein [Xanthobacteraceae bacterium]